MRAAVPGAEPVVGHSLAHRSGMARNRRSGGPARAKGPGTRKASGGSGSRGGEPAGPDGLEMLYGVHPVREALRARRRELRTLWIRQGPARPDLAALEGLAAEAKVRVERVARERIDALAPPGAQTQGVGLIAGPLPELDLREGVLGEGAARGDAAPRWVALDGVEDPQNLGAIARVADSAGAAGLILTQRRAAPLSPVVARASAGAIEWLPVVRVPNLSHALAELRAGGFWSLGATAHEATSLYAMEDRLLEGPLVVVLGAEGRGIRPGVLREIDHRVWIPMLGGVESLNAASAAAVLLYDLVRRQADSRP